jgi:hypothetical protein
MVFYFRNMLVFYFRNGEGEVQEARGAGGLEFQVGLDLVDVLSK